MTVHLVLAHPLADSLNAHLARGIETGLTKRGVAVDRLDLYAGNFQPALTTNERAHHYDQPQPAGDVLALQQRLAAAEHLILVFPTWWFSLPAILKGWFDRVWSPGFAFDQGTPIVPRLTHLKSVLVVTTLGSPAWIDLLVMRRPLRRVLKTALIGACAPQARFTMLSLYGAEELPPERLERFEARIAAALQHLD
ncbi:MAG: NAD(P)H-dependent oxidoreductase [Devosia sp.]|uniref:NAD(P)H-dependent oxidoreductase n=1 Tax=Devosia sp. TaxID=1871048 RepID=UPI0024C5577D|nr:NAD(P)H-dependent oxidoreductase [Devosia sp.]UYN99236.1 MAG: NAD(P)H-dependent oxidoreductase [Devosia sp.]